eukprot:4306758-Amphidinium_carterae.1
MKRKRVKHKATSEVQKMASWGQEDRGGWAWRGPCVEGVTSSSGMISMEAGCQEMGCISLENGGADLLAPPGADSTAPRELEYFHRVTRAVPETQSMEIATDQRHIAMIWKELGLDERSSSKDLPSVKLLASELNQLAESSAMSGERIRQYRSLVMRIVYLSIYSADLFECVRHMEGDWARVLRVR